MNITKHRSTRLAIRSLVIALAAGVVPVVAATTSAEAAPYCGITWGSAAKSKTPSQGGYVTGVRSGRHACYDRLVIDVKGKAPGYFVRYVSQVTADGSGAVIPTRGAGKLEVVVKAPSYTPAGTPTFTPRNPSEIVNVTGYTTFRQVVWGGSFEGYTTLGMGVRARLPYRVFTIDDGATSRIVIDVAHRW